ncbi:MAG: SCO family protein [Chitinophagales bacterium]|nr:SCO family protein [Chitinophagales bacterium]
MSKDRRRNNTGLLIALLVVVVFPLGFYYYFEHLRKEGGTKLPDVPILSKDSIPFFKFVNQLGDTITADSLKGKIVIADFFYTTCPGMCIQLTSSMERVQNMLAKNEAIKTPYLLLSHTVNPANDSVPVLKSYAQTHHVDPEKWWLLTGKQEELYALATQFYKLPAMQVNPDSALIEPFVHSERFAVLDKEGRIRGYFDGRDTAQVNKLMETVVLLDIKYAQEKAIEEKKIRKGKKD